MRCSRSKCRFEQVSQHKEKNPQKCNRYFLSLLYILPSTRLLVKFGPIFLPFHYPFNLPLSDIYFISHSPTQILSYSLFLLSTICTHKVYLARVPFACLFFFLVVVVLIMNINVERRKRRANDTNQIMNLYKWNTAEQYYIKHKTNVIQENNRRET